MIYIHPNLDYFIATDKKTIWEGFVLGHIAVGEKVGVGYPYLHNVYRVGDNGDLRFSYHHTEKLKYEEL